jgi:hypothetical protein
LSRTEGDFRRRSEVLGGEAGVVVDRGGEFVDEAIDGFFLDREEGRGRGEGVVGGRRGV